MYYAAGIMPVTRVDGQVLFLVGRELRDSTFADFGGKCERSDRNDPLTTAVREFVEETYGCVAEYRTMRARLGPSTCLVLRSHTQNCNTYYMYLVEVPYSRQLRNAFHKTLAFLRSKNLKMLVEKTDLRWVTLETLLSPSFPKRSVFANTISMHRKVLEDIVRRNVPWRAMCLHHARQHGFVGIQTDAADDDPAATGSTSMSWRQ